MSYLIIKKKDKYSFNMILANQKAGNLHRCCPVWGNKCRFPVGAECCDSSLVSK